MLVYQVCLPALHQIQYSPGEHVQVLLLPDHSASRNGKTDTRTGLFWQPAKDVMMLNDYERGQEVMPNPGRFVGVFC